MYLVDVVCLPSVTPVEGLPIKGDPGLLRVDASLSVFRVHDH